MARLSPRQRSALAGQLKARAVLEKKLETDIRRTYRAHLSEVRQGLQRLGIFAFPKKFQEDVSKVLFEHYMRCAKEFSSFSRQASSKKKWHQSIEKKAWQELIPQAERRLESVSNFNTMILDERIRTRLEEIFRDVADKKATEIQGTSEQELQKYIDKIIAVARAEGIRIPREQIAAQVESLYVNRTNSRAKITGVTETTFAVETAKRVEVEELIDELEDDELADLVESEEDAEDILAEIEDAIASADGEDGISEELLALAGGAAAVLAGITLTKTWIAVMDDTTRPAHADADGQTVGVDEPFNVDGDELEYPGDDAGDPGNVINCRCTTVYGIE